MMKKIILLLIIFICISEVKAYDVTSEFYYDDEKVAGMWITREKDSVVMSGLPFFLKRKSDDAVVYCLEPFSMLKQEDGYKGYYENNSYFNLFFIFISHSCESYLSERNSWNFFIFILSTTNHIFHCFPL